MHGKSSLTLPLPTLKLIGESARICGGPPTYLKIKYPRIAVHVHPCPLFFVVRACTEWSPGIPSIFRWIRGQIKFQECGSSYHSLSGTDAMTGPWGVGCCCVRRGWGALRIYRQVFQETLCIRASIKIDFYFWRNATRFSPIFAINMMFTFCVFCAIAIKFFEYINYWIIRKVLYIMYYRSVYLVLFIACMCKEKFIINNFFLNSIFLNYQLYYK